MTTRPKSKRRPAPQLMLHGCLLSAGLGLLSSCVPDERPRERVYTVYVDIRGDAPAMRPTPAPPAVESVPTAEATATAETTVIPTATPTAKPTPAVKPSTEARDNARALNAARKRLASLRTDLLQRGLLPDDVRDGAVRLRSMEVLLKKADHRTAVSLLNSFESDLQALRVDEVFITQKNARLLERIQEVKPSPEVQSQIDRESEAINQLLETADYAAINRRMNDLFQLLEPAKAP